MSNFLPVEVTDLDLACAVQVGHLMPPGIDYQWDGEGWGKQLFSTLFFNGGSIAHLQPKPGIDPTKAIRHIRAVMSSFEPKHENKEAAVGWMFENWFTDTSRKPAEAVSAP